MGQKEDIEKTENKIIFIREQRVILDRDVAELYGVETRRINEALKNNPEKFPDGYVIELTDKEKQYVVENFDHLEKLKYSHVPTKAFTEKGLYMLATILKSPLATEVTIARKTMFIPAGPLLNDMKPLFAAGLGGKEARACIPDIGPPTAFSKAMSNAPTPRTITKPCTASV